MKTAIALLFIFVAANGAPQFETVPGAQQEIRTSNEFFERHRTFDQPTSMFSSPQFKIPELPSIESRYNTPNVASTPSQTHSFYNVQNSGTSVEKKQVAAPLDNEEKSKITYVNVNQQSQAEEQGLQAAVDRLNELLEHIGQAPAQTPAGGSDQEEESTKKDGITESP